MSVLIVWAQRPHFAAQPSEAYTRLMRAFGALAMTLLTSTSLKTLQEQTIIASSHRVVGSTEVRTGFLGQWDPPRPQASVMSEATSECLIAKAGA